MTKLEKRIKSKHHLVRVVAIGPGRYTDQELAEYNLCNTKESVYGLTEWMDWCKNQFDVICEFQLRTYRRCRGGHLSAGSWLGNLVTATTP